MSGQNNTNIVNLSSYDWSVFCAGYMSDPYQYIHMHPLAFYGTIFISF